MDMSFTSYHKKVSAAKDHGKIFTKDKSPLVLHLLRNGLFRLFLDFQGKYECENFQISSLTGLY